MDRHRQNTLVSSGPQDKYNQTCSIAQQPEKHLTGCDETARRKKNGRRGGWGKLAAFFRKRYISKLTTHFCTLSTLTGGTFILLSCTVNLKR